MMDPNRSDVLSSMLVVVLPDLATKQRMKRNPLGNYESCYKPLCCISR